MANNNRPKHCLPPPRSAEERAQARRLYESGEGYRAIHEATQVPISTLRVWCKRDDWEIVKPETAIVPTASEMSEFSDVEIPDTLQEAAEEYETNMRRASVIVSRRIAQMPPAEIVQKADRIKQIDSTARKALRIETEKPACAIQLAVLCGPARPAKKDDGRLRSTHNPTVLLEAESA